MEYTNYMTGEEYNYLRESVDWRPITPGQAERGLQNTSFLVVARDKGKAIAPWDVLCLTSATRHILEM